jgi:hypothetical protein
MSGMIERKRRRSALLMGSAAAASLIGAAGARADAIEGNWCAPDGRTLTIEGPRITTPDGTVMKGDYDRHGFTYVVPAGEAGAGTQVTMVLLNEETVRLTAEAGSGPEIWRRCDVTS